MLYMQEVVVKHGAVLLVLMPRAHNTHGRFTILDLFFFVSQKRADSIEHTWFLVDSVYVMTQFMFAPSAALRPMRLSSITMHLQNHENAACGTNISR